MAFVNGTLYMCFAPQKVKTISFCFYLDTNTQLGSVAEFEAMRLSSTFSQTSNRHGAPPTKHSVKTNESMWNVFRHSPPFASNQRKPVFENFIIPSLHVTISFKLRLLLLYIDKQLIHCKMDHFISVLIYLFVFLLYANWIQCTLSLVRLNCICYKS